MLAWYRVVYVSIYYWAARSMGLSSERFCHAAIGRLMDGDRGHWFSLVHPCVWLGADHTFTPITHTHTHTESLEENFFFFFFFQLFGRFKCWEENVPPPGRPVRPKWCLVCSCPLPIEPPLSLSPSFLAVLFTSRCTLRGYTHRRQIHIFIYIVLFISKYIRAKAVRERTNSSAYLNHPRLHFFFFLSLFFLSSCGWIVARVPSICWASLAGGRWRETVEIEVVLFICCGWPPLTHLIS